jgi:hypothetical protein
MRRAALAALLLLALITGSQAQPSLSGSNQGLTGWSCSLDDIGATLTLCQRAAEEGRALYITDIVAQSTTTTVGQFILRTGTGTNCGTGTASLFPSAATAVRWAYPPSTAAPLHLAFASPIRIPHGKDLCALGIATETLTLQAWGYVGSK